MEDKREFWTCQFVEFTPAGYELVAEGRMTFAEADVVTATWFAGLDIQVVVPEDYTPDWS